MIYKNCPVCDIEYSTYPSIDKKTCSRKCAQKIKSNEANKRKTRICKQCNNEFIMSHPTATKGIYCSKKCFGIGIRKDRVDRNGYWYICKPEHPNSSSQGYVAEHHLVMEEKLGHFIEAGMVVHHKDEDKKNNDIDNLEYITDSYHKSIHMSILHKEGRISTIKQRSNASIRMKNNNPSKDTRGKDGRYIKIF